MGDPCFSASPDSRLIFPFSAYDFSASFSAASITSNFWLGFPLELFIIQTSFLSGYDWIHAIE